MGRGRVRIRSTSSSISIGGGNDSGLNASQKSTTSHSKGKEPVRRNTTTVAYRLRKRSNAATKTDNIMNEPTAPEDGSDMENNEEACTFSNQEDDEYIINEADIVL
ncbi:hypothetical protein JCGZ_25137 [Jatropha curcas]|uniref:Uncharacterized protein n=1 Tax=Jatropha curcas TaxID=180498 RepID=A0A067JPY3_JATCU|nr:hypothetical protein JCGZ_25137 [Jatropha curcas]